jgi:RNA polymerase sigma-70 factor, ECF subfamily
MSIGGPGNCSVFVVVGKEVALTGAEVEADTEASALEVNEGVALGPAVVAAGAVLANTGAVGPAEAPASAPRRGSRCAKRITSRSHAERLQIRLILATARRNMRRRWQPPKRFASVFERHTKAQTRVPAASNAGYCYAVILAMTFPTSARPWLRPVAPSEGDERLSDEALIAAVVGGNDRVAAELYDRLAGVIDRSLYRVFGRREVDHDDLVQSVFEQVVLTLARGSYAGNCSLKTWAARIASNVGLNALRARRRERRVVDHNAEYPQESPSNVDTERHNHARAVLNVVMRELADMNPRRAQAVLLHDMEGYDLEEIAKMSRISVAAAQSRLVRGRRELLRRLDANEKRATLRRRVEG